jgi:phosphatidylglycerol:prolipoprotein diacylglycerol transferase
MFPRLAQVGPVTVYSYGLLVPVACALALYFAMKRAPLFGLKPHTVRDIGLAVVLSGFLGSKLLLLLVNLPDIPTDPGEWVDLMSAGGVFYGGGLLGFASGFLVVRRRRLPTWRVADLAAPPAALGHALGRLGCFLGGCCYGRPADLPWAVTFTDSFAAAHIGTPLHVPLHPTQLYEMGAQLAILGVLLVVERTRRLADGSLFALFVLLYAPSRFVVEEFRGDPRGLALGLSTSQWISLALVPVSLVMLSRFARARERVRRRTVPAPS